MKRKTSLTVIALLLLTRLVGEGLVADVKRLSPISREGGARFLFGVYHVSWIQERYEPQRYDDLSAVAENGINAMVAGLDPTSYTTHLQFLERARKKNVGVIAELYLPSLGILIDIMKDYPSIIAWQIGDDFNVTNGSNYATPEILKSRHQVAKALDPGRPTYASGGTALVKWYRSFKDYHGCVDMVGMQVYPIGNQVDFPVRDALESAYQLFRARVGELAGSGITPVANLQSFSWKEKPALFPTASESRNMLYGALDAGAKGVLYYAFYEGKNINGKKTLSEQCPLLWEEIGKQAEEMKILGPFFLEGRRTELSTLFDKVHAALWSKGRESLIVVFSTERTLSRKVEIRLPGAAHGNSAAVFKDRPAGMQIHNGILTGTIQSEEVHVYRINDVIGAMP